MTDYKWPTKQIEAEFEVRNTAPQWGKVRKFQRLTDSMTECVAWAVASHRNDVEQKRRVLDHGTGAF